MPTAQAKAPIGLFAQLLTQTLALLFCVGVPALVTMIAPVSWVSFQRGSDGARTDMLALYRALQNCSGPAGHRGQRAHA